MLYPLLRCKLSPISSLCLMGTDSRKREKRMWKQFTLSLQLQHRHLACSRARAHSKGKNEDDRKTHYLIISTFEAVFNQGPRQLSSSVNLNTILNFSALYWGDFIIKFQTGSITLMLGLHRKRIFSQLFMQSSHLRADEHR